METKGRVLIIDDDTSFRFAMRKALRRLGFETDEAESGEAALRVLHSEHPPDVALLDLRMRGIDGLEVLARLRQRRTKIIVLTGHGTVRAAVEAMRLGAFSFLEKPVDAEILEPVLKDAVRELGRSQPEAPPSVPPLIGTGPAMQEVRAFIERVGPSGETVAIYGETGTGKEVVAHHLHLSSPRASGPFVALNSATVPENLFESELFGHKKGAFTGATRDEPGLFVEADGGTLFIDELAELPIDSQAKLLRAIESRSVRAVGDTRERAVDVRIIAATNRHLWNEVQAGRFREDLFFRLQVFPVVLPALRERVEDIGELATHLLGRLSERPPRLSPGAERALAEYRWPGNIRELMNVLRRASLFVDEDTIGEDLLRQMIAASIFGQPSAVPPAMPERQELGASLAEVERSHIAQVLTANEGNVTKAAQALGIDRRTLQRKMRAWDET